MNVLSLFDGMSCGRIALDRAGIKVDNYYASEIDKYAQVVSEANYPDIIRLGDVTKWHDWWHIDIPDLIIAGSPCQGFSFAGKQLNFEDPRSKLFFEFVDILNHYRQINPDIKFMLENVNMKKEYRDVISQKLGVEPIKINSALLSAQKRNRWYWTNIEGVEQPDDKGVTLKDIIESGVVDRDKSFCLDVNYWKGGNLKAYFEKHRRQLVFESKNGKEVKIDQKDINTVGTFYESRTEYGKAERRRLRKIKGRDTTPRCKKSKCYIKSPHEKANCLVTVNSFLTWIIDSEYYIRKLTPIECERLQTVPDNYTNHVSNTQRYKMLGNGWTVDVIAHIFRNLPGAVSFL